jgi:hypothetical protein
LPDTTTDESTRRAADVDVVERVESTPGSRRRGLPGLLPRSAVSEDSA